MPLAAVLDHVAVAVPDIDKALGRWHAELGGGRLGGGDNGVFATRQLRFAGGGRLELLAPSPAADRPTFVSAFLDRYGAQIHHVTLMVADLRAALAELEQQGLDVVDVRFDDPVWYEGFLRPSQVGGLVVQIAQGALTEDEWARRTGQTPEDPAPGAARLLGPTLAHPDPGHVRWLWSLLGATVTGDDTELCCTWPHSPLDVVIVAGEPGPRHLRMRGTVPRPAEAGVGPAVVSD